MDLGKVTKQADGYEVRFERMLAHPIERVWDALTNTSLLKLWFTDIEMDFREGGKMTIRFRDEARSASYGEIIKIDAPHTFIFTWEGEVATWQLYREEKNQCRLILIYSKISDEYAVNVPAGFHTLLDRLTEMLQGNKRSYLFGAEQNDPEQKKLLVQYGTDVYEKYPQLEKVKPVVVEKILDSSAERVWQAITVKEQMKQWYFDLSDFKPTVGFTFQFPGQGHKGQKYLHLCTVVEVIPLKKISYSWEYENMPGYSIVTFELFQEHDKTRLKLTHRGLETFPQDSEDFSKSSFNGGWNELITRLLPQYLEKSLAQ